VATHSLVSRAGLIPASLTRDRPGLLCRTVKDAATVLAAVAGYDPRAASDGQLPSRPIRTMPMRRGCAASASAWCASS
jgi:Asp-tRNA(Asn)/Glu-tRNA(Gln) amidotransferase A subunit family amidase